MTAANVGNWNVKIGTSASPEILTSIEEVLELDGFGAANELLEVTNWDTAQGEKEFIGGLAEGDEFTVTANFISGSTTQQQAVRADKGSSRQFEITFKGSSPNQQWTGVVVLMGWRLTPSIDEQNKCEFTFKVSGGITEAGGAP